VIRLTVALLVFGLFTPTVFAQCAEQKEPSIFSRPVEIIRGTEREYQNVSTPTVFAQSGEQTDRQRIFSGWLEMVKSAESVYEEKNGRYGDLTALRKAHLLRSLVFESGTSAAPKGKSQDNFVPKGTLFQVTVSANGQHFRAAIGDKCVSISASDRGRKGSSPPRYFLEILRDIQDGPDGPIISVAR